MHLDIHAPKRGVSPAVKGGHETAEDAYWSALPAPWHAVGLSDPRDDSSRVLRALHVPTGGRREWRWLEMK